MKRILITGANKGIGLATVRKLLESFGDTYVLLGSRDLTRGKEALENLLNPAAHKCHRMTQAVFSLLRGQFLCSHL